MENSGRFLSNVDAPRWYVALGEKWVGPLNTAEVEEKIQNHEFTWAHFIWKRGQTAWRRICETRTFQPLAPQLPPKSLQKEVLAAVRPLVKKAPQRRTPVENREWYLYYKDTQFGPFSLEEIKQFLKIGKIHLRVFTWKEGMKTWKRLGEIDSFQKTKSIKIAPPPSLSEQRNYPRRPLVARILISNEQTVIMGVCRDISTGGLQVLTEKIPGSVNTQLKMNISPSTNDSGNPIEAFVAEGTIVRILEDGRGFSFRFEKLSEQAKKAIESYIESPL